MRLRRCIAPWAVAAAILLARQACGDEVELVNGIRIRGKVVKETADAVTIRTKMADGEAEMSVPRPRVHAITVDGDRRVINPKPSRQADPHGSTATRDDDERPADPPVSAGSPTARSRAQVEALIRQAGASPPQWWDEVPLEYPRSLDLSWPDKPPGPWNAQRNVGQYLWSVINENPHKWRSGIRFLHYMLTVHKDDGAKLGKTMNSLASSYFKLLEDYARAAFWWRQGGTRRTLHVGETVYLAECYWRLGSKAMATQELAKVRRYLSPAMVKLWSDMGEMRKALALADAMGRYARLAPAAYVAAGDACRQHGRYRGALAYYQKVLAIPATGRDRQHMEKVHARARASIEAVKVYDTLDLTRVPDGTYSATVMAYAGPITVDVTVRGGRIEAVKPKHYQDKQYYGSLTEIPKRIVERQSLKGIDAVTQATITSQAILNAAAKALAGAMK